MNSNQFFTEDTLMLILFYLNQMNISQIFMHILIHSILIFFFHSFEQEENGKLSFLDVEASRQPDKCVTTVYRKSSFGCVYIHIDSFLPSI